MLVVIDLNCHLRLYELIYHFTEELQITVYNIFSYVVLLLFPLVNNPPLYSRKKKKEFYFLLRTSKIYGRFMENSYFLCRRTDIICSFTLIQGRTVMIYMYLFIFNAFFFSFMFWSC